MSLRVVINEQLHHDHGNMRGRQSHRSGHRLSRVEYFFFSGLCLYGGGGMQRQRGFYTHFLLLNGLMTTRFEKEPPTAGSISQLLWALNTLSSVLYMPLWRSYFHMVFVNVQLVVKVQYLWIVWQRLWCNANLILYVIFYILLKCVISVITQCVKNHKLLFIFSTMLFNLFWKLLFDSLFGFAS